MKALTLPQPRPSLAVHAQGPRPVLTMPWSTPWRGTIALASSKAAPTNGETIGEYEVQDWGNTPGLVARWFMALPSRHLRRRMIPLPLGEVVAVADLTDIVPIVDDVNDLPDDPACIETMGPRL